MYVKDLSVFMVNNADDMDKLMTMGNKNRSVGATQMNLHSSRSHAIFSITVECSEKGTIAPFTIILVVSSACGGIRTGSNMPVLTAYFSVLA